MAVYKVPQDVEAEDKLVAWLTFRQFVYLVIAVVSAAVAFFMFQVFPLLAIIPLPVVILFGVLALPLRKDQPMETYLLALLRFYLKPKQRLWNPDGTISYVEVTAPKAVEERLAKEFSGETAKERLDYLARVMDSRGWALKGVNEPSDALQANVTAEAQGAVDVLDEGAALSKSFEDLIAKKDQERRKTVIEHMQQSAHTPKAIGINTRQTAPAQVPAPQDDTATADDAAQAAEPDDTGISVHYNPYPAAIHQKVVHPIDTHQHKKTKAKEKPKTESSKPMPPQVSPDIMRLATSKDLSISALANEAHRLEDQGEVVINLH